MRADLIVAEQAEQAGQAERTEQTKQVEWVKRLERVGQEAQEGREERVNASGGRRCGNNSTNPVLIFLYCLHHACRTDDSEASFLSEDSSF